MRKVLIVCILLVAAHTYCRAQQTLAGKLQLALGQEGLTGAVWTVVHKNGSITSGSAGIKNSRTNELLKATDRVHIGSITKTVLAVGMLRMVNDGLLQLNDPVEKHLRNIRFINPWQASHPVRVRHLLDHTSGLEDMRFWQVFSREATPDTALSTAFSRKPSVLRLRTVPGTSFSYSNMGYTLLAMIVEQVTGERYESYLDRTLLTPLGMSSSTFRFIPQEADATLAMGHLDDLRPVAALPFYLRPAGQFTTTAHDMGLFIRFLLGDGTLANGQPFVRADLLKQMGVPQQTDAARHGLKTGYSLGAFTRDRYGAIGTGHSGNIVGFHAMVQWFPEAGSGFFISHNMDSETANYERFNEILTAALNPRNDTMSPQLPVPGSFAPWNGYYIPLVTKYQPLQIIDLISNFTQVSTTGKNIELSTFQKPVKILGYLGGGLFRQQGRVAASHVFFEKNGQPCIADGFITYSKVPFYRLLLHWVVFGLALAGIIYVLAAGLVRLLRGPKTFVKQPLAIAFFALLLAAPPIFFFMMQPFTALGDKTLASFTLAAWTILFPLAILIALGRSWQGGLRRAGRKTDVIFMLFILLFFITLLYWGIIPFRMWV